MNDYRFYSLLKEKVEKLDDNAKFVQYALAFANAPYVWGGEEMTGTDCSGLVCAPLMFMGYDIRVSADALLKNVTSNMKSDGTPLIFFVDNRGKAKHVGIYVSSTVVMHASGSRGVTFDYDSNLLKEYRKKGYFEKFVNLDFKKCEGYKGNVYGKDKDYV